MQVAQLNVMKRLSWCLLGLFVLVQAPQALADEFIWAPDFPVGTVIPEISAQDQDGTVRMFDTLKGEKGLVLVLSRSFEW